MHDYITRSENVTVGGDFILTDSQVVSAVNFANNAIRSLSEQTKAFDIDIFEALGMRNLSGIVGEYLVKSIERFSDGKLSSNPHQDGYPDLLLTDTEERKEYFKTLYTAADGKKYLRDKSLFSPYKYGGLEVKATCGSTPSAKIKPKPLIGEQRISSLVSFDWKAHHRFTNNLIGVLWDFYDEIPTIVAVFYRNDLSIDDWGKIVHPKDDGGRTTSVSIMNSQGVKKMCAGWIAVLDDEKYVDALSRKNRIGYRVGHRYD